jgi:hypothetical protein
MMNFFFLLSHLFILSVKANNTLCHVDTKKIAQDFEKTIDDMAFREEIAKLRFSCVAEERAGMAKNLVRACMERVNLLKRESFGSMSDVEALGKRIENCAKLKMPFCFRLLGENEKFDELIEEFQKMEKKVMSDSTIKRPEKELLLHLAEDKILENKNVPLSYEDLLEFRKRKRQEGFQINPQFSNESYEQPLVGFMLEEIPSESEREKIREIINRQKKADYSGISLPKEKDFIPYLDWSTIDQLPSVKEKADAIRVARQQFLKDEFRRISGFKDSKNPTIDFLGAGGFNIAFKVTLSEPLTEEAKEMIRSMNLQRDSLGQYKFVGKINNSYGVLSDDDLVKLTEAIVENKTNPQGLIYDDIIDVFKRERQTHRSSLDEYLKTKDPAFLEGVDPVALERYFKNDEIIRDHNINEDMKTINTMPVEDLARELIVASGMTYVKRCETEKCLKMQKSAGVTIMEFAEGTPLRDGEKASLKEILKETPEYKKNLQELRELQEAERLSQGQDPNKVAALEKRLAEQREKILQLGESICQNFGKMVAFYDPLADFISQKAGVNRGIAKDGPEEAVIPDNQLAIEVKESEGKATSVTAVTGVVGKKDAATAVVGASSKDAVTAVVGSNNKDPVTAVVGSNNKDAITAVAGGNKDGVTAIAGKNDGAAVVGGNNDFASGSKQNNKLLELKAKIDGSKTISCGVDYCGKDNFRIKEDANGVKTCVFLDS